MNNGNLHVIGTRFYMKQMFYSHQTIPIIVLHTVYPIILHAITLISLSETIKHLMDYKLFKLISVQDFITYRV